MIIYEGTMREPNGRRTRSRRQLEEAYRRIALEKLEGELALRSMGSKAGWLSKYSDDPNGFIREILGEVWDDPSWVPWRAFINAVFAKPFSSKEEEDIYRDCTKRSELPKGPFREVWAPVGRRGGKSRVFALLAVWLACCRDWRKHLVKGEAGVIPVIADARDRAQQTMGYIRSALEHPRLNHLVLKNLSDEIHLKNHVIIRVSTASIKAARSRTVLSALCDEIAFWSSDELGANPDKEIIRSLRPAMLTIPGSMLFCLSSPYSKKGELWEQYRDYYGKDDDRRLIWQASTFVMHPSVDMGEIDRSYQEDPVAASAEYGAEFRTDIENILPHGVVDACIIRRRYELPPSIKCNYVAFVDPSGGSQDAMTLAIAHFDGSSDRIVLDLIREVKPPFSPEDVVMQFSAIIKSYSLLSVSGDKYAGEWPRERFSLHGIRYEVEPKTRSEIYQALIPIINSAKVELLDNSTLFKQLTSLERRTRSSARDSIDHPPGSHDDVSNAAAGAIVNATTGKTAIWSRPWNMPNAGGGVPTSAVLYSQRKSQAGRFGR